MITCVYETLNRNERNRTEISNKIKSKLIVTYSLHNVLRSHRGHKDKTPGIGTRDKQSNCAGVQNSNPADTDL